MIGLALFPQTLGAVLTAKLHETVKVGIVGGFGGEERGETGSLGLGICPW